MKITNNYNIPQFLVDLVKSGLEPPSADVIRVTDLINSPLQRIQKIRRWDDISRDAVEFITSELGTAWHLLRESWFNQMDSRDRDNYVVEERLTVPVSGGRYKLSGKPDVIDKTRMIIDDLKILNTRSYKADEPKENYIQQQNIYAWLYSKVTGKQIERIQLSIVFRDWFASDAMRNITVRKATKIYPTVPFEYQDIPLWTNQQQTEYISRRLAVHIGAIELVEEKGYNLAIKELECSDEDKWRDSPIHAVKTNPLRAENGGLCASHQEAQEFISKLPGAKQAKAFIEFRPSVARKCQLYCDSRGVCPFAEDPIIY